MGTWIDLRQVVAAASLRWLKLLVALSWLVACAPSVTISPTPPPLARQIVFYNWEGDMPQSILDAFTQEYGVAVDYQVYESQEEAIDNLRAGKTYDVVVMDSRFIPLLVNDNVLAEIDYHNVPNFKNISANFRDLAYDPNNRHTTPYNWGTTGLIVRRDLVPSPVKQWSDLWDPRYAGKVAIWSGQPREVIALTLKSLGYSANSVKPAELEAALKRLLELKSQLLFLEDYNLTDSSDVLARGKAVIAMGYAGDVLAGREKNSNIDYVLPADGALIWGDTFILPANSPNKYTAELFLNFILRPDISAQITNENHYATANEAARPFIDPGIRTDLAIFPRDKDLQNAELILPLSPAEQELYDALWTRFMATP